MIISSLSSISYNHVVNKLHSINLVIIGTLSNIRTAAEIRGLHNSASA